MPIFEFVCKKCKGKFDYLVRSSQDHPVCPRCKGKDLQKLMSSFAFSSRDASGAITASSGCSGCAGADCSHCHG